MVSLCKQAYKRNRSKKRNKAYDEPDLFSSVAVDETRKAVKQSFAGLDDEISRKKKIEAESFYSSLDIELPEIDKRIADTKRIVGSQEEVLLFVKSALLKFNSEMSDKGAGFYEIYINDPRLVLQQYGDYLPRVTFDPELALTHPDAIILDAGHPIIRKLIELVKSEFFSSKGLYGRNAYFFSEQVETVVYQYNFLVRYIVGLKEKRVIEELITIAIDSYSEKPIPHENIIPANTTRSLSLTDLSDYIQQALNFPNLDNLIQKKIGERKLKLIEERQELYKKILIDSMKTDQPSWLDEIIYLEEAGYDLLTLTIIQPL
jgi:hypothetical protein